MIKIKLSFVIFLFIVLYSGLLFEISYLLLCVFVHELGHIIMILLNKCKIKSIEFTGIGFFIDINMFNIKFYQKLLIYSGGILFNLLLILLTNNPIIENFNKLMIYINLIPINPLDGYQILNICLSQIYEDEFINDILFYFGLLINVVLLIFSLIFKIYFLITLNCFLFIRLIKYRSSRKYSYLNNLLKLSF